MTTRSRSRTSSSSRPTKRTTTPCNPPAPTPKVNFGDGFTFKSRDAPHLSEARTTVVGGGLAGSECAWQLAQRGVEVTLVEQKPHKRTPAQQGDGLAELVCSNSFRGEALPNAVGLLKEEMRRAGSLVMAAGENSRVPAGGAFAVDRERFSAEVTRRIEAHSRIRVEHREVTGIPEDRPVVIATGPLTGHALAEDIARTAGR
ncbi:MAG: FAD-dependent oxidoreductase, partial [Myxococcota bacterium]